MSVGTVGKGSISLGLDPAPMWRTLASTSSSLGSHLRSIGARASAELSRALKTGLAVGTATTAGVAAFSAKVASDMENMQARLRRVSGLSAQGAQALGDKFRALAATTAGVKLEEVFGVGAMASKLGVAGAELDRFVKDILMFSAGLEGLDLERATEGVVRLQAVFGLGRESTRGITSAIVGLDNISTAAASDILDITTRMAPMAKAMNMGITQTLALSAALKEAGNESEVAGSAMTQLLAKLAEAKSRPKFAAVAGVDPARFGAMFRRDPLESIKALAAGMARLDPEPAVAALEGLGLHGVRVRSVLLSLAATTKTLDKYVSEATREMSTGRAVLAAFGINSATTSAQMDKLWNNVKLTAESLGKHMLPVLKAFADGMSHLLADVRASLESNAKMFERWGASVANAVKHVSVLWRQWPKFLELGRIFGSQTWDQFKEIASRLKTLLGNTLSATGSYLGELFGRIGKHMANAMVSAFAGAGAGLLRATGFDKLLTKHSPMAMQLLDAAANFKGEFKAPAPADFFGPQQLFAGLPEGIFGALPDRAAELARVFGEIARAERAREAGKRAADAAQKKADDIAAGVQAVAAGMGQGQPLGPPRNRAEALRRQRQAREQQQAQANAAAQQAMGLAPRRRPRRPPRPALPMRPPVKLNPREQAQAEAARKMMEEQAAKDRARGELARKQKGGVLPQGPMTDAQIEQRAREILAAKREDDARLKMKAEEERLKRRREEAGLPPLVPPQPPVAPEMPFARPRPKFDVVMPEGMDAIIPQRNRPDVGAQMDRILHDWITAVTDNTNALKDVKRGGIDLNPGKTMWDNNAR